jgi:hypothetical protein
VRGKQFIFQGQLFPDFLLPLKKVVACELQEQGLGQRLFGAPTTEAT